MTDNVDSQMLAYYRERAPVYDASMGYTDARCWNQHRELVDYLRRKLRNRTVLEVACGPGRWTQAVADNVRSLVAIDVNESVLVEARRKSYPGGRVIFRIADAYTLEGVGRGFTGSFAVDWWSHIPKSRLPEFLWSLHRKLAPGASVVFVDQLPRVASDRVFSRRDHDGNQIQKRWLPSGRQFEVIKNFPTKQEIVSTLDGMAEDVVYFLDRKTRRWVVAYTAV